MKHSLGIVFCLLVIKYSESLAIGNFPSNSLRNILEKSDLLFNDQKGLHPDFIQISIRKLKNDGIISDEMNINQDERQIPVISDIERIKKVIEIIEFVGEKVGDLIDKIQLPATDPNDPIYDYRSSESNTTIV